MEDEQRNDHCDDQGDNDLDDAAKSSEQQRLP